MNCALQKATGGSQCTRLVRTPWTATDSDKTWPRQWGTVGPSWLGQNISLVASVKYIHEHTKYY